MSYFIDNKKFRQFLAARFDINELRVLAFDLGIDFDQIKKDSPKNVIICDLIEYAYRRKLLLKLLRLVLKYRPDPVWRECIKRMPSPKKPLLLPSGQHPQNNTQSNLPEEEAPEFIPILPAAALAILILIAAIQKTYFQSNFSPGKQTTFRFYFKKK